MAGAPSLRVCERLAEACRKATEDLMDGTKEEDTRETSFFRSKPEMKRRLEGLVQLAKEAARSDGSKSSTIEGVKRELSSILENQMKIRRRYAEARRHAEEKKGDPLESALLRLCRLLKVPMDSNGRFQVHEVMCADLFMEHSLHRSILALPRFTELRILSIVNCSLDRMPDLDALIHLERADFTDNNIVCLQGSEASYHPSLKRLVLDNNGLSTLDGIGFFPRLRHLSINLNGIQTLQGTGSLPDLEVLEAAGNQIGFIGESLEKNSKLQKLDLAGNPITEMIDLVSLACLEELTEVCFSSREYGSCPISESSSYLYNVLFQLPRVKKIDGFVAKRSSSQLAEMAYFRLLWEGNSLQIGSTGTENIRLDEIEEELNAILRLSQESPSHAPRLNGKSRPHLHDKADMEDLSWTDAGPNGVQSQDLWALQELAEPSTNLESETASTSLTSSLDNLPIGFTNAELELMRRRIDEEVTGYRGCVPQILPPNTQLSSRPRSQNKKKKVGESTKGANASKSVDEKKSPRPIERKNPKNASISTSTGKKKSKTSTVLKSTLGGSADTRPKSKLKTKSSPTRPKSTWSGRFGNPTSREL